jgi:steroid delta-isomerase-like uncharacterized protein
MVQQVTTHEETHVREMFHKVFHEGNLDAADQYVAANMELHLLHKRMNNLLEWKQLAMTLTQAFPDIQYECEDFVVEGNKIAFRWEARGTHKGEMWGVPASDKKLIWHGITLFHFEEGKISKGWTYSNFSEVLGSLAL